jgi:hypothetical protein
MNLLVGIHCTTFQISCAVIVLVVSDMRIICGTVNVKIHFDSSPPNVTLGHAEPSTPAGLGNAKL